MNYEGFSPLGCEICWHERYFWHAHFYVAQALGNCNFSSNVSNIFAVSDRKFKFVHIFVRVCQSRALLFKLSVVRTLTFGVNRLCQHTLGGKASRW